MEQRTCPECGGVATEEWGVSEFHFPFCPNGHGKITEEGLLEKRQTDAAGTVYCEMGRRDCTISSGNRQSERVMSLLEAIYSLEKPEQSTEIIDFSAASARTWNRKRAKRRFQRWLRENENRLPPINDSRLRQLAEQLIRKSREKVTSDRWNGNDELRWAENDFLQNLKEYELRRDGDEPILLLPSELPEQVSAAFEQAVECYRWRLDPAAFGLCRIVLELAVRSAKEANPSWPTPINESFRASLNCIPETAIPAREKKWISQFWDKSSHFLHGREEAGSAWEALDYTSTVPARMCGRKCFGGKHAED